MTIFEILIGTVILLLILTVILIRYFLVIINVSGNSMSPALEHGERVVALRHWPSRWLTHKQIVIGDFAKLPGFTADTAKLLGGYFIKRVAGLSGEKVTMSKKDLPEPNYFSWINTGNEGEDVSWQIPVGHFFVVGDSLESRDCRLWGPIPLAAYCGIMLVKLSNPNETHTTSTQSP